MSHPRCVVETIEMLRMIEQAVVEDSLAYCDPQVTEMASFVEAHRARVANAVRIYCATFDRGSEHG